MAKLTDKTAVTTIEDEDIIHIVQDVAGTPVSRKMTIAQLKTELDLYTQAEVDAKAESEAKKWALILG